MGLRSLLLKPFTNFIERQIRDWSGRAIETQDAIFRELVKTAGATAFGKDHGFDGIRTYRDFCDRVPVRDYEELRPYFDRVVAGESGVLWPGRPRYFAKTSGTTSGVKYIPLTRESLYSHFISARNTTLNFASRAQKYRFLDGKMIFLSGSPEMDDTNGIPTGRLSGIVNHQIPFWLKTHQKPSYKTNCIEDWETKVDQIVRETVGSNMTLISGIPTWVQMYYERLLDYTGKSTILEIFPNFEVFVYGGVNMNPYRMKLESLVGGPLNTLETYPASEGFIAFQDEPGSNSLLLNTNAGIFFEFIPVNSIHDENPERLTLADVSPGVNYALIVTSNAGLWAYNLGDTIMFDSVNPYRIRVTGRIKQYLSAFGEHIIAKEVEEAIRKVSLEMNVSVAEFTVAPQVTPDNGLPHHEWFIAFDEIPSDTDRFAALLDEEMRKQNIYYDDLIAGKILRPLVLRPVESHAFVEFMRDEGKLGGQNKVPHLSNDRKIADKLKRFTLETVA